MTIKNIEYLKKCRIVCRNIQQVKDCLNYLKQLGFKVKNYFPDENYLIISGEGGSFSNYDTFITFAKVEFYNKELVKTLQKFIKEKEEKEKIEDIEVASDGRIIKVNNKRSGKKIFIIDWEYGGENSIYTDDMAQNYLDFIVKYGIAYATKEARDRALFKIEIKTKLKNIAERLNKGRKIDWKDSEQVEYCISYDFKADSLGCYDYREVKHMGQIYCLDKNFLDVAKKEIGEEQLIKYFKEDFD